MFNLANLKYRENHKGLYLSFPWAQNNPYMGICLFIRIINVWVLQLCFRFTCKILSIFKEGPFKALKPKTHFLSFFAFCVYVSFGRWGFHWPKSKGETLKKIFKTATKSQIFQAGQRAGNWAPFLERKIWNTVFLEFYHHPRILHLLI